MGKIGNFLTMLGFAQKSGKIVSGDTAVNALLNKKRIYLLIIAEDLSNNRKKHWKMVAQKEQIPILVMGTKVELGLAIGLSPRAIIGVTDETMVKALEEKI